MHIGASSSVLNFVSALSFKELVSCSIQTLRFGESIRMEGGEFCETHNHVRHTALRLSTSTRIDESIRGGESQSVYRDRTLASKCLGLEHAFGCGYFL